MLPPERRVRRSAEFTDVVRRGAHARRPLLAVFLLPAPESDRSGGHPSTAGLVVGKTVGGSVVRHRTSRRLRHLLRDRLDRLPAGMRVVVRAQAGAGSADSATLGLDLDAALAAALAKGQARAPRRTAPAADVTARSGR